MTTPKFTIEEIVKSWKEDSKIDETQLNIEICRTPSLHSKYIEFYQYFKGEQARQETRLYKAGNIKRRYYRGECTQEELKKYGWEQFQGLKPSMSEMTAYLDHDEDMIKIREEVATAKSAVATIEYILKSIGGRDYSIKSLVEYLKYVNGA